MMAAQQQTAVNRTLVAGGSVRSGAVTGSSSAQLLRVGGSGAVTQLRLPVVITGGVVSSTSRTTATSTRPAVSSSVRPVILSTASKTTSCGADFQPRFLSVAGRPALVLRPAAVSTGSGDVRSPRVFLVPNGVRPTASSRPPTSPAAALSKAGLNPAHHSDTPPTSACRTLVTTMPDGIVSRVRVVNNQTVPSPSIAGVPVKNKLKVFSKPLNIGADSSMLSPPNTKQSSLTAISTLHDLDFVPKMSAQDVRSSNPTSLHRPIMTSTNLPGKLTIPQSSSLVRKRVLPTHMMKKTEQVSISSDLEACRQEGGNSVSLHEPVKYMATSLQATGAQSLLKNSHAGISGDIDDARVKHGGSVKIRHTGGIKVKHSGIKAPSVKRKKIPASLDGHTPLDPNSDRLSVSIHNSSPKEKKPRVSWDLDLLGDCGAAGNSVDDMDSTVSPTLLEPPFASASSVQLSGSGETFPRPVPKNRKQKLKVRTIAGASSDTSAPSTAVRKKSMSNHGSLSGTHVIDLDSYTSASIKSLELESVVTDDDTSSGQKFNPDRRGRCDPMDTGNPRSQATCTARDQYAMSTGEIENCDFTRDYLSDITSCDSKTTALSTVTGGGKPVSVVKNSKKKRLLKIGSAPLKKISKQKETSKIPKKRGRPKKEPGSVASSDDAGGASMSDYWKHKMLSPQRDGDIGAGAQLTPELSRHVDETIDAVLNVGSDKTSEAPFDSVTTGYSTDNQTSGIKEDAKSGCLVDENSAIKPCDKVESEEIADAVVLASSPHRPDKVVSTGDSASGTKAEQNHCDQKQFLAADPLTELCSNVVKLLPTYSRDHAKSMSTDPCYGGGDTNGDLFLTTTSRFSIDGGGDCPSTIPYPPSAPIMFPSLTQCSPLPHVSTDFPSIIPLHRKFAGRRLITLSNEICKAGEMYISSFESDEVTSAKCNESSMSSSTAICPEKVATRRIKHFLDDSHVGRYRSDASLATLCSAELSLPTDDSSSGHRLVFVLNEQEHRDEIASMHSALENGVVADGSDCCNMAAIVDLDRSTNREVSSFDNKDLLSIENSGAPRVNGLESLNSEKSMPSWLSSANKIVFGCSHCCRTFNCLQDQLLHQLSVHMLQQPDRVMCVGCPLVARRQIEPSGLQSQLVALLRHYMRHIDVISGRQLASSEDPVIASVAADGTMCLACSTCPRVFTSGSAFGAHVLDCPVQLLHVCRVCSARYSDSDQLRVHELEHRRDLDGRYSCDLCTCKFSKVEQFAAHRRFHFKAKTIECDQCGKKFISAAMLNMHIKWKHSEGPCRFCARPFSSATARRVHEEHSHLKHLPHMCPVCRFRVPTPTQLRVHRRLHDERRPHSCQSCNESFVSRGLLRKHTARVHEKNESDANSDSAVDSAGSQVQNPPTNACSEEDTGPSGEGNEVSADTIDQLSLRKLFDTYRQSFDGVVVADTAEMTASTDFTEPAAEVVASVCALTLSDLDTDSDADEQQNERDEAATHELFQHKDKQTKSVWSCPVCRTYFTKLWGVRAHITLKHPGTNVRPTLHDASHSDAASKKAFLRELKRNVRLAKKQDRLARRLQERLVRYGTTTPKRGRPLKNPLFPSSNSSSVVKPRKLPLSADGHPRKRGRPRKVVLPDGVLIDSVTSSSALVSSVAKAEVGGSSLESINAAKSETKNSPPMHVVEVERRRWRCTVCGGHMDSYDDIVTHTYTEHPDLSLPEFTVVVDRVSAPTAASTNTTVTTSTPQLPTGSSVNPLHKPKIAHRLQKHHSASKLSTAGGRGARGISGARRAVRGRGIVRKPLSVGASGNVSRSPRRKTGGVDSDGNSVATSCDNNLYRRQYNTLSSRRRANAVVSSPMSAASITTTNAPTPSLVDDKKLYCLCQVPYDEGVEMIGCDGENCRHEWFHFGCVNIVTAPTGNWYCPECSAKQP